MTTEQPPSNPRVWARLMGIPDPILFNAVAKWYALGIKQGETDPPCNPNYKGRHQE